MSLPALCNLLLFKLTWLTLVLGGNAAWPIAALLIALGLACHSGWRIRMSSALMAAMAGLALDTCLVLGGLFVFPEGHPPLWLALLWIAFTLTLPCGLGFLLRLRLRWLVLAGAAGGAVAYGAAWRLGAVQLPYPVPTLLLVALAWAFYLPLVVRLFNRSSPVPVAALALLLLAPLAGEARAEPADFVRVGGGTFKFMWWSIYDADLLAPPGDFTFPQTRPFTLRLQYHRAFTSEQLVNETLRQWREMNINADPAWFDELNRLMPAVERDDTLSMMVEQDWSTRLQHNDVDIGVLQDPTLVRAFASIWLGDDTTHPDFRRQLLGLKP